MSVAELEPAATKPSRQKSAMLPGKSIQPAVAAEARRDALLAYAQQHHGLSTNMIKQAQEAALRMAKANPGSSLAAIFAAQIFSKLSEAGLARLSVQEVLALAKETGDQPDSLAIACVTFLARHPPHNADAIAIRNAIRACAIGGLSGLERLHKYIIQQQQKAAKRRAKLSPARPKLLSEDERIKIKDAAEAEAALAVLYKRRREPQFKAWMVDFLEAANALYSSGYALVPSQIKVLLEIKEAMTQH